MQSATALYSPCCRPDHLVLALLARVSKRRLNVDMLKLIQLGLTFTDAEGNLPRINGELCVWQFNFRCAVVG